MITLKRSEGQVNEWYGLSGDTKPENAPNASIFYEMDTHTIYMYDAQYKRWLKQ